MNVTCSKCGLGMEIDRVSGVAYVREVNGDIHHDICPETEDIGDIASDDEVH